MKKIENVITDEKIENYLSRTEVAIKIIKKGFV